jgi:hypothetical protein
VGHFGETGKPPQLGDPSGIAAGLEGQGSSDPQSWAL